MGEITLMTKVGLAYPQRWMTSTRRKTEATLAVGGKTTERILASALRFSSNILCVLPLRTDAT